MVSLFWPAFDTNKLKPKAYVVAALSDIGEGTVTEDHKCKKWKAEPEEMTLSARHHLSARATTVVNVVLA